MRKKDVKQQIKRTGFCFTDVETRDSRTVRISASGPKFPSTEGAAGERDTIVKATGPDGQTLERHRASPQGAGARIYVELVEKYARQSGD